MTESLISVASLIEAQNRWTRDWHFQEMAVSEDAWLSLVQLNHWNNFSLWHHEDTARRSDAGHELIYHAKRAIDGHNQKRNDAMEQMDAYLIKTLRPKESAPLNSETPGMMIDRLSIMALKDYHMAEEVERTDVDEAHREKCAQKLEVIRTQRSDLAGVLERFFEEIRSGQRRFKVYFQFKMYNDPSLNPELYRRSSKASQ